MISFFVACADEEAISADAGGKGPAGRSRGKRSIQRRVKSRPNQDCATASRLRRNLGRQDMKLLFNINAEFAHSLDARPIELRARSAVFSSLADAILVSGPVTGEPADRSQLQKVCETVKDVPVFANTGVTIDNVKDTLALASGVIIGTHFKVDGNPWNPVDGERVKRFMDRVATLR